MLTYHLQQRVFRTVKGGSPQFPGTATVRLIFEPGPLFGVGSGPLRVVLPQGKIQFAWDGNTGRAVAEPDPPIPPLACQVHLPTGDYQLETQVLTHSFQCTDMGQLEATVSTLSYLLPALMSAHLPQPVRIVRTHCIIGDTEYNWELAGPQAIVSFAVRTKESLEAGVESALRASPMIAEGANRRLAAAIHYVHVARRLLEAGVSQWEFLAEAVLNFNKAVEVLFGESRDQQREGLVAIGYERQEIETSVVPLLLLRDSIDIAHPRLALFKRAELDALYRFLDHAELIMNEFLTRLLRAVENKVFVCADPGGLTLSAAEQRKMDALLVSMAGSEPLVDA